MNAVPRLAAPALAALALALAPASAQALTANYCDFDNLGAFELNGDARQPILTNYLRLTSLFPGNQGGTAFYKTPIPFPAGTAFHAFFRFRIGGGSGADGMTFMLQGNNAGVNGNHGAGLGYRSIGNSVAVEFDTYQNATDPNGNHVGLLVDGNVDNHLAWGAPGFKLANGKTSYAWIDYDGATLSVFVAQAAAKPATPAFTALIDIAAHVGAQAWVGFSGGTGGDNDNHDVFELQFSTDGFPCCTNPVNGACDATRPLCDNGLCAQCLADKDCPAATPRCDPGTRLCAQCLADTDCAKPTPRCEPVKLTCVGCLIDADCSGATPTCEATTGTCQPMSSSSSSSSSSGATSSSSSSSSGATSSSSSTSSSSTSSSSTSSTTTSSSTSSTSSSSSSSGGGTGGVTGSTTGTGGQGGTTSSTSSTSSSTSAATGGTGGTTATGGAGGAADVPVHWIPQGGGCWCGVGRAPTDPRAIAAAALLVAAIAGRRRRRG